MIFDKVITAAVGTILVVLTATACIQTARLNIARGDVKDLQLVIAKEGERQALAVAGAVLAAVNLERARQAALEEIIRDAETTHQRLQDAAIRAESDRDRLRLELKTFVARSHAAGGNSTTAGPGQALVDSPVDLLAELYGRSDEAAGIFATEADDRLARLVTCGNSYQAVKVAGGSERKRGAANDEFGFGRSAAGVPGMGLD